MKKITNITEKLYLDTVNEEFANCKQTLKPLLDKIPRGKVKFKWNNNLRKCGGYCWYYTRQIEMNSKYKEPNEDKWNFENFKLTLRHEIIHLVAKGHDKRFCNLLEMVKGHRYVGQGAYTRPEPKK